MHNKRQRLRDFVCAGLLLAPLAGYTDPPAARQAELMHLLKHDCGSCHGMTRKGGLGPALLPETLVARTDEQLVLAVLDGRPGTPMPPWRGLLTEAETVWLIRALRAGDGL
jgi:cytochrome c55X